MEEEKTEVLEEDAATEEASPEEQDSTDGTTDGDDTAGSENIDYKKDLETLEQNKPKEKSELEKAERALFFNAKRFEELGGDPRAIIGGTAEEQKVDTPDVRSIVNETFAEREARQLAKSEDEYNLIMWRVKNQGLSVEEAHLLANKGRLIKRDSEMKRADVKTSMGGEAGQRVQVEEVPARPEEEVKILERRGLVFNEKTKTYQGKHTEEYWDGTQWATRKRTS